MTYALSYFFSCLCLVEGEKSGIFALPNDANGVVGEIKIGELTCNGFGKKV